MPTVLLTGGGRGGDQPGSRLSGHRCVSGPVSGRIQAAAGSSRRTKSPHNGAWGAVKHCKVLRAGFPAHFEPRAALALVAGFLPLHVDRAFCTQSKLGQQRYGLASVLRPRLAPVEASCARAQAHPHCVGARLRHRAQRNREPSASPRTAFQSAAEQHADRVSAP